VLKRWQGTVVYKLLKVGSTKLLANEQPIPGLFLSVLRVPLAHLHLCCGIAKLHTRSHVPGNMKTLLDAVPIILCAS